MEALLILPQATADPRVWRSQLCWVRKALCRIRRIYFRVEKWPVVSILHRRSISYSQLIRTTLRSLQVALFNVSLSAMIAQASPQSDICCQHAFTLFVSCGLSGKDNRYLGGVFLLAFSSQLGFTRYGLEGRIAPSNVPRDLSIKTCSPCKAPSVFHRPCKPYFSTL